MAAITGKVMKEEFGAFATRFTVTKCYMETIIFEQMHYLMGKETIDKMENIYVGEKIQNDH